MTGALYFTYTRSALIAVGLGLVSLFLFMRTRIRGEAILIMMLIISGILVISPLGGQYIAGRPVSQQEDSTVSRQILWQAGLSIALDHPIIGIGSDKFMEVSKQYQSSVDPLLIAYEKREYWGYTTLGNVPPHNDFLNMWVSYGTFALLVFITLFVIFLRNLLGAFQISRDGFLKGLAVGLAAALVAYGVNAFYHNVVAAISLFWIMGGFSLAISKLVIKKELC
jgi:O-antigen ligase